MFFVKSFHCFQPVSAFFRQPAYHRSLFYGQTLCWSIIIHYTKVFDKMRTTSATGTTPLTVILIVENVHYFLRLTGDPPARAPKNRFCLPVSFFPPIEPSLNIFLALPKPCRRLKCFERVSLVFHLSPFQLSNSPSSRLVSSVTGYKAPLYQVWRPYSRHRV